MRHGDQNTQVSVSSLSVEYTQGVSDEAGFRADALRCMHGRFTGGTTGPRVDRVASLRDGDLIRVVVLTRTFDILVKLREFVSRRSGLRHSHPRYTRGVLALLAKPVRSIAHASVTG